MTASQTVDTYTTLPDAKPNGIRYTQEKTPYTYENKGDQLLNCIITIYKRRDALAVMKLS